MDITPGYVYFISEDYFKAVNDPHLMLNKGELHKRPFYCCKQDENPNIYWMVPLTSQTAKFRDKFARDYSKYGNCLSIVLGRFSGRDAAFLIQNACPVSIDYIADIYMASGNPVPVHSRLQSIIYSKLQRALAIHERGYELFFTDIDRIKKIMYEPLKTHKRPLADIIYLAEQKRCNSISSTPLHHEEKAR